MKNHLNKKLLVTLMALVFSAVSINTVFADDMKGKAPGEKNGRFEKLAKELNLTDKQKQDLMPMLKQQKEERRQAMKTLMEKQKKELSTVLNPEQMDKFEKMVKERRHNMLEDRKHGKDMDD